MHICFVNMPAEYYSPVSGGAISTVIMNNARILIDRGHRVTVLTIVNDDLRYDIGEILPVEAKTRDDLSFLQRRISSFFQNFGRWDWPYFEYFLRSVKKQLATLSPAPDAVILFNDFVSPSHLRKLLPKTRIIVWLHNEWRTRYDMAKTIGSTDLFLTCSEYVRRWTANTHGIPLDRIFAASNGVDVEMFTPRPGYLEANDTLKVLFLGRIDPNKGPDIAADAVAAVRAQGVPATLTVAGGLWFYGNGNEMDDPFFRILKSKMDTVHADYLGHVPRARVPQIVRDHDVACVLSRSNEPFGLVALEAMASGCAVVSSDRGGLPEACGGAADLVDPDNLDQVVSALRTLGTDKELLRQRKVASTERARRQSWAHCAQVVEKAVAGGVN